MIIIIIASLISAFIVGFVSLIIIYCFNKPEKEYYIIKFKQFKALYTIHPEAWYETILGTIKYIANKDHGYYRENTEYIIFFNFIDYYRYKLFMFSERFWVRRELPKDLIESFQNDIEIYKTKSRKDLEERKEKLLKEVEEARKRLI